MKIEEWRAVPGYEGLYEVSSFGTVRSLDRIVNDYRGLGRLHRGRLLTPNCNHSYARVSLSHNGKVTYYNVHNLVAMAFLGYDPDSDLVIDHIDNCKINNHISNLEIVTQCENIKRAAAQGLMSKLSNQNIEEIKLLYASRKFTLIQLAKRYKVSRITIWRHLHNWRNNKIINTDGKI